MDEDRLEKEISEAVNEILLPYFEKFHTHRIDIWNGEIEVRGQIDEKETSRVLILRININYTHKQIYIPNIFMPNFMRNSGIGKSIISCIWMISERYGYSLFVTDLVPSFYRRLVKRGAVVCEENETVLITKETDLSHKYAIDDS